MIRRSPLRRSTKPMTRTAMKRGTTRVGEAARRRIKAGGPTSKGRESLSAKGYAELRRMIIMGRAGERDEATGARLPFAAMTLDHCKPRSAGGADSWANCWAATISTQRWKEAPYSGPRGRLLVEAHGDGTFTGRVAIGSKHDPVILTTWTWGRKATVIELAKLASLR